MLDSIEFTANSNSTIQLHSPFIDKAVGVTQTIGEAYTTTNMPFFL